MTRRRRNERSSVPRIDRAMLRDQGERARIDHVWERLERNVALGVSQPSASRGRWTLVATSVAAGFAIGVSVAGWLWSERPPAETVVMAPEPEENGRQVFAAGAAPRTYALPGGGLLTVEPGTIIDTLSHDQGTLTLRLLRGEATLSSPAGASQQAGKLSLVIGRAQVTAAGRMRIRHDGDTAFVRVLSGSAEVSAPDGDKGMKAMVLGPDEEANVPVRVVTASLEPTHRRTPRVRASEDDAVSIEVPTDEPIQVAVPRWVVACDSGDYDEAVTLLAEEPGGAGSLAQVTDGRLLNCIASGHEENKDTDAAIAVLDRMITEFGEGTRAMIAASNLARIYRKRGESDKAQHYAALRQRLSKDLLLSGAALCEKIARKAEASEDTEVLRLSVEYQNQFPDGPCTDKIRELVAAIEARGGEAGPPDEDGEGGASPYQAEDKPPADDARDGD